jgi:hypothetical protein
VAAASFPATIHHQTDRHSALSIRVLSSQHLHTYNKQQNISIMASANQATREITTAVDPHSTTAITTTNSQNAANLIEPPEDAAATFTEQDAPLLRLPGEIRNRIYHEVFRTTFNKLEANKKAHEQYDPKVLRPTLTGLIACRQIHQEAMAILFRAYVAEKPSWWCLQDKNGISSFFTRSASFCQTIKRYAPHARFSVQLKCSERQSALFTQDRAKAFVKELARQYQQPADLSFELAGVVAPADLCLCPSWMAGRFKCDGKCSAADGDAHWEAVESYFHAEGTVGGCHFTYTWCGGVWQRASSLKLEDCLAQLDWDALENA